MWLHAHSNHKTMVVREVHLVWKKDDLQKKTQWTLSFKMLRKLRSPSRLSCYVSRMLQSGCQTKWKKVSDVERLHKRTVWKEDEKEELNCTIHWLISNPRTKLIPHIISNKKKESNNCLRLSAKKTIGRAVRKKTDINLKTKPGKQKRFGNRWKRQNELKMSADPFQKEIFLKPGKVKLVLTTFSSIFCRFTFPQANHLITKHVQNHFLEKTRFSIKNKRTEYFLD